MSLVFLVDQKKDRISKIPKICTRISVRSQLLYPDPGSRGISTRILDPKNLYPDLRSRLGSVQNRTKFTTAHQNNWQNLLNVPRSGIGYKFWFRCPHIVTGSQDQYPNLKIRYPDLSSQNRRVGSERFGYRSWDPGTDLGIWRRSGYKFSGSRKSYLFLVNPKKICLLKVVGYKELIK
jgi:hypothetical protein